MCVLIDVTHSVFDILFPRFFYFILRGARTRERSLPNYKRIKENYTMSEWQKELERVRVPHCFSESDIFWVPDDQAFHEHVDVYGKKVGMKKARLEQISDAFCHGFYLWTCQCSDHGEPDIEAEWCQVPRHAVKIMAGEMKKGEKRNYDNCVMVTCGEKKHPNPAISAKAVCYSLRLIKKNMAFEVYDKPNNAGMVIIRPVITT